MVGGMYLSIVVQRKRGKMRVRNQPARSTGGNEALLQVVEVAIACIQLDDLRMLKPHLDNRDGMRASQS